MSYITTENAAKQNIADRAVRMMMSPDMFSQETLCKEMEPCVKRHMDRVGPFKPERRCCNSKEFCEVFDAGPMGRGVRAKRTIWANTHIGCYTGVLRANSDKHTGDWRYNYTYALKDYYIDASQTDTNTTCMMALLNHSDKDENVSVEYELHEMPDMSVECHIVFIAKRAIMRMEELYIDYGPDYWRYANKMGVFEVGNKYAVEKPKHVSILRVDESDDDEWPTEKTSPYFVLSKSQKLITDYMV